MKSTQQSTGGDEYDGGYTARAGDGDGYDRWDGRYDGWDDDGSSGSGG